MQHSYVLHWWRIVCHVNIFSEILYKSLLFFYVHKVCANVLKHPGPFGNCPVSFPFIHHNRHGNYITLKGLLHAFYFAVKKGTNLMDLALRYFYIHNTRFYKTYNMMPTVSTMQLNCQLNTSFLKQPSVWHKGLVEQRCQRFFLHKKSLEIIIRYIRICHHICHG